MPAFDFDAYLARIGIRRRECAGSPVIDAVAALMRALDELPKPTIARVHGAAFGGGMGVLAHQLLPNFGLHPEAWALVGMAGLIAGTVHAPITAIFMVFEMTDDYNLVPPLMIVSVIAFATARRFAKHGLYDGWLARRGEHLAHGADRAIMHRLLVRDVMSTGAVQVSPDATLAKVVEASSESRLTTIPVVDEQGVLYGVITFAELRLALLDRGELAPLLLAADLTEPTEIALATDTVQTALAKLNARAADLLPVVESEDHPVFIGVLFWYGLWGVPGSCEHHQQC